MIYYTEKFLEFDSLELAQRIAVSKNKYSSIYAVPRGGVPFGIALSIKLGIPLIRKEDISESTLIVDDVVDSGRTLERFSSNDFAAIHVKKRASSIPTFYCYREINQWIHYFWEGDEEEHSIQDSVIRQLQYIGEDVTREGLIDTPKRVIKSWKHLFSGYSQDPGELITTFDSDGYDEIVLLKDIEMYSMCEHHLLPFFGKAHVAYIPNKKVIGVSKLARIVEMYSRRAQIQERIGEQVTKTLMDRLNPKAAACIIEAQHLCMLMRGVQKQNSVMVTSSLKGSFLHEHESRKELLDLIKLGGSK